MRTNALKVSLWIRLALLAVAAFSTTPLLADSFYTLPPCRVLDTRSTMSSVPVNTPILFTVGGLCGIPPMASSVSFNVTLVEQDVACDLGMGRLKITARA